MNLFSYDGLRTAIGEYLNRADLVTQIPSFIVLAEARFNRELRVNAMLKRDYTRSTSDYLRLPLDWLQHQSLVVTGPKPTTHRAMDYISPEEFNDRRRDLIDGPPALYTIINDSFAMLPAPKQTTTFEVTYYAKIPALADDNQSNWLLARSPDLYLYTSLLQAESYLMNDERIPLWSAAATDGIEKMRMESERASRPTGALRARVRTFG